MNTARISSSVATSPFHKLFERFCDLSLLRLVPDKITQLFGVRISKRLHAKLHSVLEKIDHGHHVFRACGRNAVLRMYEKFSAFPPSGSTEQ